MMLVDFVSLYYFVDVYFDFLLLLLLLLQLKTCGGSEACKVITETATTFLVNAKCRCAHDETCPSSSAGLVNTNNGGRKTETVRYGNGALHMIYCP
jgi:hypothetical protein